MNDLYNNLSIFVSSGLLLALGVMLLFSASDENPLLGNYRRARRAIAVAYLFFAVVNAVEYLLGDSAVDVPLIRAITLTIAASQAFLFTFAMLALLEVRYPGWRSILREATPALVFVAAVFIVYTACSEACFGVVFWIFAGVYVLLLLRYTMLFVRSYRRFRRMMDNWFSDNEADRLRWVAFSFYAALVIGVGALMTSIFVSTLVALCFTVVFDLFYLFFAVRFNNYAHRFSTIGEAMDCDAEEETAQQNDDIMPPATIEAIETGLKEWVGTRGFLAAGVKIGDVAQQVGTNDKYLSLYINNYMACSFHEWIGTLRVGEAQRLMSEQPELTIHEIAARTGFANQSHFSHRFRTVSGTSPSGWRRQSKIKGK